MSGCPEIGKQSADELAWINAVNRGARTKEPAPIGQLRAWLEPRRVMGPGLAPSHQIALLDEIEQLRFDLAVLRRGPVRIPPPGFCVLDPSVASRREVIGDRLSAAWFALTDEQIAAIEAVLDSEDRRDDERRPRFWR